MALYPEVQKRAQAEIDAVVGPNRLPDFQDRPSLPYVNAVIKESLRWHLVLPLGEPFFIYLIIGTTILTSSEGVPHMATNDDEYDGYYIPKGTLVIPNAWSIRIITATFSTDFYYLGPYYMILKSLITPWNFSPNGI